MSQFFESETTGNHCIMGFIWDGQIVSICAKTWLIACETLPNENICKQATRNASMSFSGVPGGRVKTPHEILKALQNRAKVNPIVKTVKNC